MWWLWMLLVGDWNRYEWIGGACAAALGATLAELVHALSGVRLRMPWRVLASAPQALVMVLVDFATLTLALFRRRRGRFVVRDGAPPDPAVAAWEAQLTNLAPNAIVVDVDPERDQVLLHDVVEVRASESPAG